MPKGGGIDDGGKSGAGEEGSWSRPPPPLGGSRARGTLGADGAPEETPFSSPLAFMFEQRHGKLDVRSLHRLDIDDIVRNVDVDALHGVLENLTFCELRPSDLPTLTDVSIVKLSAHCSSSRSISLMCKIIFTEKLLQEKSM